MSAFEWVPTLEGSNNEMRSEGGFFLGDAELNIVPNFLEDITGPERPEEDGVSLAGINRDSS